MSATSVEPAPVDSVPWRFRVALCGSRPAQSHGHRLLDACAAVTRLLLQEPPNTAGTRALPAGPNCLWLFHHCLRMPAAVQRPWPTRAGFRLLARLWPDSVNHLPLEALFESVVGAEMPSSCRIQALKPSGGGPLLRPAHIARPADPTASGEHHPLQAYRACFVHGPARPKAVKRTDGSILHYQGNC